MTSLDSFAKRKPVLFGVAVLLLFCFFLFLGGLISQTLSAFGEDVAPLIAGLWRVLAALVFIGSMKRMGWLEKAGYRLKNTTASAWILSLIPALILAFAIAYSMTRSFAFDFSNPLLSFSEFFMALMVGLVEETVFRGMILYALLRAWGDTKSGILKAALISSVLFGLVHAPNVLFGTPLLTMLAQLGYAFLLGLFFAALLLRSGSIWVAVVAHGLIDAVGFLNFIGKEMPEPTLMSSFIPLFITVPAGLYGIYFLARRQPAASPRDSIK